MQKNGVMCHQKRSASVVRHKKNTEDMKKDMKFQYNDTRVQRDDADNTESIHHQRHVNLYIYIYTNTHHV